MQVIKSVECTQSNVNFSAGTRRYTVHAQFPNGICIFETGIEKIASPCSAAEQTWGIASEEDSRRGAEYSRCDRHSLGFVGELGSQLK